MQSNALADFGKLNIAVFGDIMTDRYVWGDISRISQEAPVGIVHVRDETVSPGGAGNVAKNLSALGAKVCLCGMIGGDASGDRLRGILGDLPGCAEYLYQSPGRRTITKDRIISAGQQVLRIDREDSFSLNRGEERAVLARIRRVFRKKIHGVVVSDYNKGVLTDAVLDEIRRQAGKKGTPIFTDPKGTGYGKYRDTFLIKPNRIETEAETDENTSNIEWLLRACRKIKRRTRCRHVAVSLGAQGLFVYTSARKYFQRPARAREVFDVSGAGDTVVSLLTLCHCSGMPLLKSAEIANIGAGIVVGKVGAASLSPSELTASVREDAVSQRGIVSNEDAVRFAARNRSSRKKVVFTNGCFDILHAGHIQYLEAARKLGDCLIVAINSDRSIRTIKGRERPYIGQENRAQVLASLQCVDCVTIFDGPTPIPLLKQLRPNVLVKGGDYTVDQVVGKEVVEAFGGEVTVVRPVPGLSTTAIVRRIRENERERKGAK